MKLILKNTRLVFQTNTVVITPEVEAIMANYSNAPSGAAEALQKMYNAIPSATMAKIKYLTLPMFASSATEALYNAISGTTIYPRGESSASTLNLNNHALCSINSTKKYFDVGLTGGTYSDVCWLTTFREGEYKTCTINGNIVQLTATNLGTTIEDTVNFKAYRNFNDNGTAKFKVFSDTSVTSAAKAGSHAPTEKIGNCGYYGIYGTSESTGGFTSCLAALTLTDEEVVLLRTELLKLHNQFIGE